MVRALSKLGDLASLFNCHLLFSILIFISFKCIYFLFFVLTSSDGQLEWAAMIDDLHVGTVRDSATFRTKTLVLLGRVRRETPVLGDEDLLSSREFVLATTKALNDMRQHGRLGTHRDQDLINRNASNLTVGLTEGTSHTRLETIGTGTGKHLVDAEDMVGVDTNTHVEAVTTAHFREVLVGANASSLKGLRRNLLLLKRDKVDTGRELVDVGLLLAEIVDTNLGIRDTTAIA